MSAAAQTPAAGGGISFGDVARFLGELAMIAIAIASISNDALDDIDILGLWCVAGFAYAVANIIGVAFGVRFSGSGRRLIRLRRPFWGLRATAIAGTICSSVFGLYAATSVLLARVDTDEEHAVALTVVGVAAMLLSWGFLHWGFARIYMYAHYRRPGRPMLRFPATTAPVLADFVYFSYTMGTAFAASDVETLRTEIRWTMVYHSVISFFFNGLIVVLALNTIMNIGK
ncbi:DUF1345 domain-containing protein [Arthrobacter sp. 35W]|uniref:DUF1345 domain-containing protein n=1 Tax=Arthrobacter sp. 35W TaxID=1132441 RepID=UPI00042354B4|nr:DUF1345 domain-containing protein [Arthrobacter sp. 35W]